MKKFTIYLKELFYGNFEIEAENALAAQMKAKSMISKNEIPEGIMNDSEGYKLDVIEESPE